MRNFGQYVRRVPRCIEFFGIAALFPLFLFFLDTSWRKWPDALIDFGRELYLPWQLMQGAVLYRDAEDFYGPFSQYLNAAIFRLFGPSMMVLVAANLLVFVAIVVLIYSLFRKAWGSLSAFSCSALFIALFGFSDATGLGNYNYATPYSHEATHGFLVCLLLVWTLARWLERPSNWLCLSSGLLIGTAAVLKPEILFAAACTLATAAWLGRHQVGRWQVSCLMAGLVFPTIAFTAFFYRHVPILTALEYSSRAWLSVVASTRFTGDPSQLAFLGFDQPLVRAWQHLTATGTALLCIAVAAGAAHFGDRFPRQRPVLLCATAATLLCVATLFIPWDIAGRCLLGVLVLYAAVFRPSGIRLLMTVLSLSLLARMALNGRLYQFGFYQAALATLTIVAVTVSELPDRLRLSVAGRAALRFSFACVLVPGALTMILWSQQLLAQKTYSVASGGDRFFAVDPSRDKTGDFVNAVSSELRRIAPGQTLLVLPDGEMINYLARMRSPVAPAFFFSSATLGGREAGVVEDLRRHPPDWILLISRDLTEFGVRQYGEREGQGKLILEWTSSDYELAGSMGGDPLAPPDQGIRLLKRRTR
jgi:hypothetical protein